MKKPQPQKLDPETPSAKAVKTIPLPALNPNNLYDIEIGADDGLFSSEELRINNENYPQNNSEGIR